MSTFLKNVCFICLVCSIVFACSKEDIDADNTLNMPKYKVDYYISLNSNAKTTNESVSKKSLIGFTSMVYAIYDNNGSMCSSGIHDIRPERDSLFITNFVTDSLTEGEYNVVFAAVANGVGLINIDGKSLDNLVLSWKDDLGLLPSPGNDIWVGQSKIKVGSNSANNKFNVAIDRKVATLQITSKDRSPVDIQNVAIKTLSKESEYYKVKEDIAVAIDTVQMVHLITKPMNKVMLNYYLFENKGASEKVNIGIHFSGLMGKPSSIHTKVILNVPLARGVLTHLNIDLFNESPIDLSKLELIEKDNPLYSKEWLYDWN